MAKQVCILLYPGAVALDVTGPAEVFHAANSVAQAQARYALSFVSEAGGLVRTVSGVSIDTTAAAVTDLARLDTLIVVGGPAVRTAAENQRLVGWVRRAASSARRTCGVCTGAFLLAAAGLLDGRRAVTHWSAAESLATTYPRVKVERDPIYVQDGPIFTSAGVTAGIDLSLALLRADFGRRLAVEVARELVVFVQRSGEQRQVSKLLSTQAAVAAADRDTKLADIHSWMVDNIGSDLSVSRLAEMVGMAERTFMRRFVSHYGTTPARFVEQLRLEAACREIKAGSVPLKQIAAACGFEGVERMRRAFQRHFGAPPRAYQRRAA